MELLFDTHAHYDDPAFDGDRDELLASLPGQGVGRVVNIGCDLESSRASVGLAARFRHVYATVGAHPSAAGRATRETYDAFELLARNDKVVAIGEIGLDYHYEGPPRELQKKVFREQMELARALGLPVVVHEREAWADAYAIVCEFPQVTGVFHCYSGSAESAALLVKKGWYLSFTGVLTFKNARRSVETLVSLPADRFMLETDCPYLAPVPYRGKRNSSLYLRETAAAAAAARGVTFEEIAKQTTKNGLAFYRIRT